MRSLLESIKKILIRPHLLDSKGELQEHLTVNTEVRSLPESKATIEAPEAGFRHIDSDDQAFLMEFLTANLSSPLGS
jgi:hypothetical protein